MKTTITALLLFTFVSSQASDIESDRSRKHYGMSYHMKCDNYVKTFTCMSACKSIGFQVFRMDQKCKCSCHELKTTTILPFYKWLTNGTTQKWHSTQSVPLYNIVGTLSPPTYIDYNDGDSIGTTVASDKRANYTDGGDTTATNKGNKAGGETTPAGDEGHAATTTGEEGTTAGEAAETTPAPDAES